MTWIKTVPQAEATGNLREVYEEIYRHTPPEYVTGPPASLMRADGSSDSIVAAHSLLPEFQRHFFLALAALLAPDTPLTRRQQEMIATLVSGLNRCFY
jgi:hypothetical protein